MTGIDCCSFFVTDHELEKSADFISQSWEKRVGGIKRAKKRGKKNPNENTRDSSFFRANNSLSNRSCVGLNISAQTACAHGGSSFSLIFSNLSFWQIHFSHSLHPRHPLFTHTHTHAQAPIKTPRDLQTMCQVTENPGSLGWFLIVRWPCYHASYTRGRPLQSWTAFCESAEEN